MNTHSLTSLHQMNNNADKYGSSQWIKNVNTLNAKTEYKLYPTNMSTIGGGREYIALPNNTKINWETKQKYNLC